ncbi:hypothetical protein bcgnr5376_58550 [Bacillus cereus]
MIVVSLKRQFLIDHYSRNGFYIFCTRRSVAEEEKNNWNERSE